MTLGTVLVPLVMNMQWWRKKIQESRRGQNHKAWKNVLNKSIKRLWYASYYTDITFATRHLVVFFSLKHQGVMRGKTCLSPEIWESASLGEYTIGLHPVKYETGIESS